MDKVTEIFCKIAGVQPKNQFATQAPATTQAATNAQVSSQKINNQVPNNNVVPANNKITSSAQSSLISNNTSNNTQGTQLNRQLPAPPNVAGNVPSATVNTQASTANSIPSNTQATANNITIKPTYSPELQQHLQALQKSQEEFRRTYPNLGALPPNELDWAVAGNTSRLTPAQLQEFQQWRDIVDQNIWDHMSDTERQIFAIDYKEHQPVKEWRNYIPLQKQVEDWITTHPPEKYKYKIMGATFPTFPTRPHERPNPSGYIGAPTTEIYDPNQQNLTAQDMYSAVDAAAHPIRTLTGYSIPNGNVVGTSREIATVGGKVYNSARNAARLMRNTGAGMGSFGDSIGMPWLGTAYGTLTGTIGGIPDSLFNAYERMDGKWNDPYAYLNAAGGLVVDNVDNAITGAVPGFREASLAQAGIDVGLLGRDAINGITSQFQAPDLPVVANVNQLNNK